MTYYKATRTDRTSFYDSTTIWHVGRITRHPNPDPSKGLCSSGVLHIADAPGETLLGGSWPCRLYEVEPRSELVGNGREHKYGCTAVKVVRELPAWQALGPNGEAVVAHIEACKTMTAGQAQRQAAARDAARGAAWDATVEAARIAARDATRVATWDAARGAARAATWDAARDAAWDAAWVVVWDAAWAVVWDAAWALLTRDLITPEQFDTLYGPWASVMEVET